MIGTLAEKLVVRLSSIGRQRTSRRGFLAAATLTGTALAVDPWGYLTRPQSAYAAGCGSDPGCNSGYTVFCCTINHGKNTCPPNTYAGGWWKADRSSYCGGAARYYIDCNAKPGHHFTCHCNKSTCDRRLVACNIFRYGQCNTQVHGVTAVVCRQISCRPPWQVYPGECGHSSATDNNTAEHTAPCLTKANTFPALVTFKAAPHVLRSGHVLPSGHRMVSPNRHTECVMQTDGNFVVRNEMGIVWSTKTHAVARGGHLLLRPTGQLVVVGSRGVVRWAAKGVAHGTGAPRLQVRNNGQLAVYRGEHIVWHTKTHTP